MRRLHQDHVPKALGFQGALSLFLLFIAVVAICLFKFGAHPHIPMFFGSVIMIAAGYACGFGWEALEEGIIKGISSAIPAVIIQLLIGILIGVWILSGVVPTLIYYGLQMIQPHIFFVASMLLCSALSVALGSWGVVGTIGIALLGIAGGLGLPPALAAGAIVSGAYFGDKLSPISDTMNLTASVAEVGIYKMIRFTAPPVGIAYAVCLVIYFVIGQGYRVSNGNSAQILELSASLKQWFVISPLMFLPLILVLVCMFWKLAPAPSLAVGILAGMAQAFFLQKSSGSVILDAAFDGANVVTGNNFLDNLLSFGGLEAMTYSMSLTIISMMFAGLAETIGVINAIMSPLAKRLKSIPSRCTGVLASCVLSNAVVPEQFLSITIPGRMFLPLFQKDDANLYLGASLSSGCITSALVPWNTCGVFIFSVLGVSAYEYLPYAFFNILTPLVSLLYIYLISNKKRIA